MEQLKIKIAAGVPMIQGPILSDCYFENREDTLVYTLRKKSSVKIYRYTCEKFIRPSLCL